MCAKFLLETVRKIGKKKIPPALVLFCLIQQYSVRF